MVKKTIREHIKTTETNWDKFWKTILYGAKPLENAENVITGHFNNKTKAAITQKINFIINSSKSIKIGKTGDSYIRSDKPDYRGTYKSINLVYRSTSKEYVSQFEEYYITKYMKSHPEKIDNKTNKRVGKLTSYDGYYYMYVVSR